jgi:hypothetical protein
VRHVRKLRLSLMAAFAVTAAALVAASPALARKAAGEGFPVLEKFDECPLGAPEMLAAQESECSVGEAGPESFFQAGKVTIHFVKPVFLQIGIGEDAAEDHVVAARNGETITKEAEPAPSLTEGLDAEVLPAQEKERYEKYIAKGGSTKVTETIELARPASEIALSLHNLIGEHGQAFSFPVMIHISNKFLGKRCYDGTTAAPIVVPYTTGTTSPPAPNVPISGRLGNLSEEKELAVEVTRTKNTVIVNNEYAAPGVSGCGIDGGADAALNAGLGLPSPAGTNTTELRGALWLVTTEELEKSGVVDF